MKSTNVAIIKIEAKNPKDTTIPTTESVKSLRLHCTSCSNSFIATPPLYVHFKYNRFGIKNLDKFIGCACIHLNDIKRSQHVSTFIFFIILGFHNKNKRSYV